MAGSRCVLSHVVFPAGALCAPGEGVEDGTQGVSRIRRPVGSSDEVGARPETRSANSGAGRSRLLVLAAARSPRRRSWWHRCDSRRFAYLFDDEAAARDDAQNRLESVLGRLAASGVSARGQVGADHPLEAVEDALAIFDANEIAVIMPPTERESWLEHDLVERLRTIVDLLIRSLTMQAVK